jgi:hypothetical protein
MAMPYAISIPRDPRLAENPIHRPSPSAISIPAIRVSRKPNSQNLCNSITESVKEIRRGGVVTGA